MFRMLPTCTPVELAAHAKLPQRYTLTGCTGSTAVNGRASCLAVPPHMVCGGELWRYHHLAGMLPHTKLLQLVTCACVAWCRSRRSSSAAPRSAASPSGPSACFACPITTPVTAAPYTQPLTPAPPHTPPQAMVKCLAQVKPLWGFYHKPGCFSFTPSMRLLAGTAGHGPAPRPGQPWWRPQQQGWQSGGAPGDEQRD